MKENGLLKKITSNFKWINVSNSKKSKVIKSEISEDAKRILNSNCCITLDDACLLLKTIYNTNDNSYVSGLQLNTIFEAVNNNKIDNIDAEISSKAYKSISFVNSNYCIDIDRCIIINEESKDLKDIYLLSVKDDEYEDIPSGYEYVTSISNFKYYQPSYALKVIDESNLFVVNPNKKYYDAIAEFLKQLTLECFSLPNNQHYHTLVLKLLFSSFIETPYSIQDDIVSAARNLLSNSLSKADCSVPEQLFTQKAKHSSLNLENEENRIYLDSLIVCNAFINTYNALQKEHKVIILEVYNKWYKQTALEKRVMRITAKQKVATQ